LDKNSKLKYVIAASADGLADGTGRSITGDDTDNQSDADI
jgi:hypothetical protein